MENIYKCLITSLLIDSYIDIEFVYVTFSPMWRKLNDNSIYFLFIKCVGRLIETEAIKKIKSQIESYMTYFPKRWDLD